MTFLNWFFDQLPEYFHREDSYQNADGEGLLQRYLRTFGQELDENLVPKIDDYVRQVDPLSCDSQYLNHIAYTMGFPPDLFPGDEARYRRFLSIIIRIYQIKGTRRAYETVFGYLGYNLDIYIPDTEGWRYDADPNHEYDEDEVGHYDGFCPPCREYFIGISPLGSGQTALCLPLPDDTTFVWDLNNFYETIDDPNIPDFNESDFNPQDFH